MTKKQNMNNDGNGAPKCWWCGNLADSGEHIFKKSDLKRIFGPPLYPADFEMFIDDGINSKKVRGPKSKLVKWKANLCENCNNARSSPFDLAYTKFINKIQPYFIQIQRDKFLDLRTIFGDDWQSEFTNVIKYYIKHIGCRLSHEDLGVPKNLINFLNGNDHLKDVVFNVEIRPSNKIAADVSNEMFNHNYEVLRVGRFNAIEIEDNGDKFAIGFFSWLTTNWVSLNYIIQPGISESGFDKLASPILPVLIAPMIMSEQFEHLPNIAEKVTFLEELGRMGDEETLQKYYSSILKNKTL